MSAHVQSGADVKQHVDSVVRAVGRYVIVDLSPHKMLHETPDGRWIQVTKVVDLELADGTRIALQVRPDDEMKQRAGQDVAVVGKLLAPSPEAGSVAMATTSPQPVMVDIESVDAA